MSYALPYDSPSAIPIGILGIYFLLTLGKWLIKHAQILRPQRPQQTNLEIQENTPSIEGISEGNPSQNRIFRSDRTVSTKAEITNDNRDSGRDSDHGTIHQHTTDSHSSGQDTSSQTFGHHYPKAVMAQFPPNPQSVPPTEEQVMTVKNYIKAVKSGRIPKGPNHAAIEELATKPHAQQTQVIVLSYENPKQEMKPDTKQHKST